MARSTPLSRRLLAGLLPVVLVACGSPSERPARIAPADVDRARTVLLPLKKELLAALTQALAEGGPEAAIDVCRIRAPAIAASTSPEGVAMGRTSLRLRNPENAPRPWVKPLLAEYQATPSDTTSRAVDLGEGRIGYVEPIHVKPLCLTCHGTEVAPTVLARLSEAYPQDRAVGFREGDLRGLFWVELPAEG